ncbi:hypothetical protein G9A89_023574 [Geosiphon pyriformis]|nr:hypothetical protein G9A89_023574 [Geosiphon pyriformis]
MSSKIEEQFNGWETALEPENFDFLSILRFRQVKNDFSLNKVAEHAAIFKFVSYVEETTINETWKKAASVLLDAGLLKATVRLRIGSVMDTSGGVHLKYGDKVPRTNSFAAV